MSGGLAEIRGWLVKGESEEAWLEICRSLEGLEGTEREMCVLCVAQHTKGWGESLRRPLYGWWNKHRRGELTGFEGVVGDWSRYAWEEGKVAGEAREVASLAGMRMRWIPAGTFWMGSNDEDEDAYEERPKREVTMTRGFWMMETPVTQGQYLALMGENPSEFKAVGLEAPVENVSWYDAAAFANKLSALEGASKSFVGSGEKMDGVGNKEIDYVNSKGWRLPTEAEWEYACRAGTTTPHYGDVDMIAWYEENSGNTTHAVGQKQANAWGLCDTLGSLWEWCYDRWDEDAYMKLGDTDPVCIKDSYIRSMYIKDEDISFFVLRGGCFSNNARFLRAAYRFNDEPTERNGFFGFRLLRR